MRVDSDDALEQAAIRAEVAKYLFSNGLGVIFTASIVSVLLAYMLWESSSHALLIGWLVLIDIVYLARIALGRVYQRAAPKDGNLWLARFRVGAIASGLVWGLGVLLLFPSNNVIVQSALAFTVVGLAAGSAMAYAIDFVSLFGYVVPLSLSLIARLIGEGTPQSLAMSIMLAMAIGFIGITLRHSNKVMRENIRLRFKSLQREEFIREKNEFLNTILENEPECVKVVARNGELQQMNRAGLLMLEVDSIDEAQQIGFLKFVQPEYRKSFIELHKSVCAGNTGKLEFLIKGKQGTLRWLETHATPLRAASGEITALLGLTRDITDQKQKEDLIWNQANFDALTGLPNRHLFQDRLEQETRKALRANSSLALLFIDLDRFKEVNDSLGHAKGDVLLIEAARRISGCVREADTVARLGGDEFTIIVTEFGERMHLERIAQCVIQSLFKPFDLGDGDVSYVSASIGITLYPDDANNLDELMKNADRAMYAAKQEGRNRYSYFTQPLQHEVQEKRVLTQDLRQALARNELEVYYQPIVDMASGRITKAEALLRWKHPKRGMVSPAIFIPLAEESGLILEIGEWVFREAIASIERWHKQFGRIIQVSVNKSPVQFEKAERHTWMDHLLSTGLPIGSITVEITEGLLIKDSSKVKNQLLEFRDSGIEVSIDDFGTGFSALSCLQRFDIDYLKIDQSFVRNLTAGNSDKALVEAIIVMAHKLGIKTVAEGVETAAQRDQLIAFGCDFVQGYLYSRPVPAGEFAKMLEV